uniref:Uncharacterized protein n=1 Tax=Tanacetum cinerariifolium TaxID=118510 RepID=A0A699IYP7_TANCI|nr:hypothetical protein [Tanacetum cinerariifolium]
MIANNHREEENQEGNNSSEIGTLTYHVLATYGLFLSSFATFDMCFMVIMYNGPPIFSLWRHFAVNDKFVTFPGDMVLENVAEDLSVNKKQIGVYRRCQQRSHGVTAVMVAVMIVPLHISYPPAVGVALATEGTRKPNLGGRRAGRLHTRQENRNLGLKAITDKSGPILIRFKVDDRETLMPLSDHASHWANYLGELVRELPLHYPSWRQMPSERKAGVMGKIVAALKERYWVPEEDGGFDLERIRRRRPSHISEADWDEQLAV